MHPKNMRKLRNGRGSPPQNTTEWKYGLALTFAQAQPSRTTEEEEEDGPWSTRWQHNTVEVFVLDYFLWVILYWILK